MIPVDVPQELSEHDNEKSIYEFFSENDSFWNQTPKDLAKYARDRLVKMNA